MVSIEETNNDSNNSVVLCFIIRESNMKKMARKETEQNIHKFVSRCHK